MATVTTWLFIESVEMPVDVMSQMIGIPSDASWTLDSPREQTGRSHTMNSWKLVSKAEVPDDTNALLKQIRAGITDTLDRIRGHEEMFRSIAMRGVSGLLLGITAKFTPPLIFDAALLSGIAALGVDLEIDIVLVGEPD